MLLPKLGGFWLLPPRDFPHLSESHPMDHDSNSSGHTEIKARPPGSLLSLVAYCLTPNRCLTPLAFRLFQPEADPPLAEPITSCLFYPFALFYAKLTSAGSSDPVTSLIRFTSARTGSPQPGLLLTDCDEGKIVKIRMPENDPTMTLPMYRTLEKALAHL